MTDETPDVVTISRFHEAYPNMPLLYHVYCAEHEDFGFCGTKEASEEAANMHRMKHMPKGGMADPQMSDPQHVYEDERPKMTEAERLISDLRRVSGERGGYQKELLLKAAAFIERQTRTLDEVKESLDGSTDTIFDWWGIIKIGADPSTAVRFSHWTEEDAIAAAAYNSRRWGPHKVVPPKDKA